jgi:hypothetical protein
MPTTPDECAPSAADHTPPKQKPAATTHRNRGAAAARQAAKDAVRRQCFPDLTYLRFADLRALGIAASYEQLNNLIDDYGFPEGVLLSPNVRGFPLPLVQDWLRARPTTRRSTPHREKQKAAD